MSMKTKTTLSEDQIYCKRSLAEWAGGEHHLPDVKQFGTGICINFYGDLSTYDWNRLTMLVLIAHRDFIRIEIASSGPRMVRIIAHKRAPKADGDRQHQRHPSLNDLIEQIKKLQLA